MSVWSMQGMRAGVLAGALMVAASVAAWAVQPRQLMAQMTSLEASVPARFGDWTQLRDGVPQMALSVAPDGQRSEEQPYDEVVMRTYVNSRGERVMLALAYAREQRQEVKIHRPEICYRAQGYRELDESPHDFPQLGAQPGIPGLRLLMDGSNRMEAVSYWIRVGAAYPRGGLDTRLAILKDGVAGVVPDAILVRASSILARQEDAAAAYERQERFLAELVHATRPEAARMLVAQK
ncbi:EpsI family protein [Pseudoduganella sp. FT25W]|jgi:EpsI family protein|uniref:EpsI family protein n=1 Tax=Duganella alba TaxID=2666081 RepID=A0A6L5QNY4_9BURK|nr:exosortase-associated protein EpsI, B-type [Duganella alba]MRX10982.1 EpsI family protein [Duganella alba]MRX19167.1 EpsI family protein [Duganella alba]